MSGAPDFQEQEKENPNPNHTLAFLCRSVSPQQWVGSGAGAARTTPRDTDGLFQSEAPNMYFKV